MEESIYDVYLYNDNKHSAEDVFKLLTVILKFSDAIAQKIVKEVDARGKALLLTTDKNQALETRNLLVSFGLISEMCKVDLIVKR